MIKKDLTPFFSAFSRWVVVVPGVVVVVALLLAYRHYFFGPAFPSPRQASTQSLPTTAPLTDEITPASPAASINLTGPWQCRSAGLALWIKNHRVYAEHQDNHYLLQGDCFYSWIDQTGEKICGLSTYVDLADSLLQTGLLDQSVIQTAIGEWLPEENSGSASAALTQLFSHCQKTPVDDGRFTLPAGVNFKESQIQ
ncbi:hypothetical protein M1523_02755 [Patescibacteria group bacterium]|nr:hypothetical protein [Patescibacteria group bacterium]MCL5091359.1 hypothetical protein [Patescibacteria group bacterium]